VVTKDTPIYMFEIKIDFLKDEVTKKQEEYKVLDTNEDCFVINDLRFTTFQYKNETYKIYCVLKKTAVSQFLVKPYYDYIHGILYTDNKSAAIAYRNIKKDMETWMYEKWGRYCKGIDLLKQLDKEGLK